MTHIAFIGLGAMGQRMAQALQRAGHSLSVHNRHPEAQALLVAQGTAAASTPRAAAEGAEVVFTMLRDDSASEEVWTHPVRGILAQARPGQLLVECSTLSPGWVARLATLAERCEAAFLEAPVVGSRPQAERGALTFLVGGPVEAATRATPWLQAMGPAVHWVGPVGSAARLKLAVNALLAIQAAALGESLGWLRRAGLEEAAWNALMELPVMSPAAKAQLRLIKEGMHAPLFPVDLAAKDLGYARAAAREQGAEAPLTEAAAGALARAQEAGLGDQNLSAVASLFT
ncbi:NAD(P)-dependent oxidoreductase [Geothrix alkalitolerans]|uniref:NAD(P)-dependent oxidoreductase n=1 Tax=Geothrix alkalitolerans TaxID=2922724 RepID=UPI001FAF649B